MLADWRSNLATLASYVASPADEAFIVRLGDRLWEQQGQAGLLLDLDALLPQRSCHCSPFLPPKFIGILLHELHAT